MKLTLMEAGKGDCFALSWGDGEGKHILIDGGTPNTYRFIKNYLQNINQLAGVFVSHVDYDHIGGFIKMLKDTHCPVEFNFPIYINSPDRVIVTTDEDKVNFQHGIDFKTILQELSIEQKELFIGINNGKPIEINGLKLTILSPTQEVLKVFHENWTAEEIAEKHSKESKISDKVGSRIVPPFKSIAQIKSEGDESHRWQDDLINASSMAFIADYDGKKILFLADSNPEIICNELEKLNITEADPLIVDAVKISHHGCKFNTSKDLLKRIKTKSFIISTNGKGAYYHPDRETIVKLGLYGRKVNESEKLEIITNYKLNTQTFITSEEENELGLIIKKQSEIII